MKSSHGMSSPRLCFAILLLGALPWVACDQSNSVGKIGDASAAGGSSSAGIDGGFVSAGGATASGTVGSAVGGTTVPGSAGAGGGAGQGGGTATGQAGASGGGKAGALGGGSGVDAGVSTAGGTTAVGGAGGTRADAAVDGHVCPPLADVYCTSFIIDAFGCRICASSGTGDGAGGSTSKGGTGGGSGGTSGAADAGGSSGKTCQRTTQVDEQCRLLNLPPQAYFCNEPALPASTACVMGSAIDSGSLYCCPDQYLACPDSPPSNGTACTGALGCSYGSHPDPTCRTRATCKNGKWNVTTLPSSCSDPQLPATCPAAPASGTACSSHDSNCYYTNGSFCTCTNCSIEESFASCGTTDTWHCWTPPGSDCPTYYPNLGTTCTLAANTSCSYTCAFRTSCSAAGMWVDLGNHCPN